MRPYNDELVHSGYGLLGRTPYGCCVALEFGGASYVGLMPGVLLDNIVLDWSRQGVPAVNDVLTLLHPAPRQKREGQGDSSITS